MPPFLPVTGLERSNAQNVRIGGQTLKYGVITYVDLGGLAQPGTVTATVSKVGTVSPGLTKSKKYKYLVTAIDAFGGETPASPEVEKETEAGAETAENYNEIKLTWGAVPNATGYNIYRTKAGGAAGTEVMYATTTETKYNDTGNGKEVAGDTPPVTNNTFFNSGKGAYSPRRELSQHSAIGAYLIAGPITASNLDWAPIGENGAWALTIESEKVKVAKAKELRQRSTGAFQASESAEASVSGIVSESEKEKLVYVVYNSLINKVEGVVGANEAKGAASLAALNEKLTSFQQPLYLLKTVGTTKTVENITSTLPNAPVIARV